MSLLDGPDVVLLFPEVEAVDEAGNPVRRPDLDDPRVVYGAMQPGVSGRDDVEGQDISTVYRFLCRSFPGGAWSVARWDGRWWDVRGEPRRRIESSAVRHATVLFVARSAGTLPATWPEQPEVP